MKSRLERRIELKRSLPGSLVFLDIDGVLNSARLWKNVREFRKRPEEFPWIINHKGEHYMSWFVEKELLEQFQKLIKLTESDIVGISSWFWRDDEVQEIAEFLGVDILCKTKSTSGSHIRFDAALQYLKENPFYETCVVLDDMPMDPSHALYPFYVQPPIEGFTEEAYNKALDVINKVKLPKVLKEIYVTS